MVSGSLVLSVSGSERTSKPERRHKLWNNHHQNGDNDDNHDDDEPSKGEEGYESRGGGDQQVAKQKNLKLFSISSI